LLDISDCCIHVTHRCHNRQFLLRFACDRRNYVSRLRATSLRYDVEFLDYAITSNHVHLLLWAPSLDAVPEAMQFLQGVAARDYNRRKNRDGAFWCDRYSPTLVQNGTHLSRCLFYIGMNLVRAGAVDHPVHWTACGYHELSGRRQRYRVLGLDRLLRCLGMPAQSESFQAWYEATLTESCATGYRVRDPIWTECVAVGGQEWLETLAERVVVGKTVIIPAVESPQAAVADGAGSYGLSVQAAVRLAAVALRRIRRRMGLQKAGLTDRLSHVGTVTCLFCNVLR
jgi:putative transposase